MDVSQVLMTLIEGLPEMHEALPIEFADVSRLQDMQLGYGVDVTGLDLSGTADGDWKASWLVFGYDYGDPVFVDRAEEEKGFPVYVAEHGTGRWEPVEVASSLAGFAQILRVLDAEMRAGDVNYRQVVAKIAGYTKNMDFWDIVIEEIEDRLE